VSLLNSHRSAILRSSAYPSRFYLYERAALYDEQCYVASSSRVSRLQPTASAARLAASRLCASSFAHVTRSYCKYTGIRNLAGLTYDTNREAQNSGKWREAEALGLPGSLFLPRLAFGQPHRLGELRQRLGPGARREASLRHR